ncbi:MAG: thiamine pyrophosphate-dependent enzyme [Methyloligellaceae bacterium]
MRHGGQILVHQLKTQNCDRVFTVPGINLTNILDGLYENAKLQTITCRQQSAASIMAQAHGQLTEKPGICLVSGLEGAINATIGLHTAQSNATPLILIVGLPPSTLLNRGTTRDINFISYFSNATKYCAIVDSAERIPEYISRAWHIATSGKPGPTIIGIPVDIQEQRAHIEDLKPAKRGFSSPSDADMQELQSMLESASRPLLVVGGSGWSAETSRNILTFAENFDLPVTAAYRCQDYINNHHTHYVGHTGTNMNPALTRRFREADLVIALGTELEENTTDNNAILRTPQPEGQLIHIHPDPSELGRIYQADLMINANSLQFSEKLMKLEPSQSIQWNEWRADARKDYENFLIPHDTPGDVKLEYIIRVINEVAPENTIITHGDGTYADWLHRYYQFREHKSRIAPNSNVPEYALPAAIASKLAEPARTVIAIVGDGGFMVNAGELATAMHYGLKIIVILVNNNMYGAARFAQESKYPNRVLGTSLSNPDFMKFAESFGITGETIEHRKMFRTILKRALKSKTSTVINLPVSENAISTNLSLSDLRSKS